MTVGKVQGVRQAEERAGEDRAPAPFDAEHLHTRRERTLEREQKDATEEGLLLQSRQSELEGYRLGGGRAAVGKDEGHHREKQAVEQRDRDAALQAAPGLDQREAGLAPTEGRERRHDQGCGQGEDLALPVPLGCWEEMGEQAKAASQQV